MPNQRMPGAEPASADKPLVTAIQIETDWILQDRVRALPADASQQRAAELTTQQDAGGGCDGIIDGTYGFHTNNDANPWWQVDLGKPLPLDRIVIYNRDAGVAQRAAWLKVLLSSDGKHWTRLYQHDGTAFLGFADKKPLVVPAEHATARWVRITLPGTTYLHLDEVEVYQTGNDTNMARHRPADQSSVSPWSTGPSAESIGPLTPPTYPVAQVLDRGRKLAADLQRQGVDMQTSLGRLQQMENRLKQLPPAADSESRRSLYLRARWIVRRMALQNPLLDFDDLLLVKRAPGSFTHMSDQYYGWFSRPGGGVYILKQFKTDSPELQCLTGSFPTGSFLRPDIAYDGRRVLFAFCRYYPDLSNERNKLDKKNIPEDAFYHLYEMNLDGTNIRRLTQGKYDDFDGRYLPDGRIVFLSTRRGQAVQCVSDKIVTDSRQANPDCYVRCGGGPERPVAVYTLHVMESDGRNITRISPFEMFEWTPAVDDQGQILYARWDYVDRYNMPYMSLWATNPDGTESRAIFGNYTTKPHAMFEARGIPNSRKIVFTASAHHGLTGGSLVMLDPDLGVDGQGPMTRLTPEVVFPECEGWPKTYFANPLPLSDTHYLVSWSAAPLPPGTPRPQWAMPGPRNDLGIYLFDAFGNLNLIYRDPEIGCAYPLPIRPRRTPPVINPRVDDRWGDEGRMLVVDVYRGLDTVERGTIRKLRLVGVPAKTHPTMNSPQMGLTRDDPGKFVLGTVPVEKDGSALFRVPAGVALFFQALDERGMAVQTMRSAAYVQSGQTMTCVGCHEPRNTTPPVTRPLALSRPASKITPSVPGSWPLDYQMLVQPVLDNHCVACHQAQAEGAALDLTSEHSYDALVAFGAPSLKQRVLERYRNGRSIVGACGAAGSPLWKVLESGHYAVKLNAAERMRLIVWMDTYGQRRGSFDVHQEDDLRQLRHRMARMLAE